MPFCIGITHQDVARAAQAVKQDGQEPTVDRVRINLGTGSRSTIAPLLKQWKADRSTSDSNGGLPSDLVNAVKNLQERIQFSANEQIAKIAEQHDRQFSEHQNQIANLNESLAKSEVTNQQLKSDAAQLLDDNKQFKTNEIQLSEITIRLETQYGEACKKIDDLQSTNSDLRQENRDIRDHFEHYQERIAEDRQLERLQHRETITSLQDRLSAETRSFESQAELTLEAKQALAIALNANRDLSSQFNKLELSAAEKQQQYLSYRSLSTALKQEISLIKEESDKLRADLSDTLEKLARHAGQNAILIQTNNTLNEKMLALEDKYAQSQDENKIILQEKAIIQGQFKQLHETV
ncbi:MAG: DNA-binding protein [Pseudomonadales bacterium]|nr:DNA-binding protein [Pseudomonadales bacterium]